jgi:hypothetical protein
MIVGKTHIGSGACVGALSLEGGRSMRLLTQHGYNQPGDTPYEIGGIWDIEFAAASGPRAPHVEDVLVSRQQFVGIHPNPREAILQFERPWRGGPTAVFDGLARATGNGSGYVSHSTGLPNRSTGYWVPNLALSQDPGKRRYLYPSQAGIRRVTYVGYAPVIQTIPSGTLVRVSLARWWRPDDADAELEERCYLQLSGWFG